MQAGVLGWLTGGLSHGPEDGGTVPDGPGPRVLAWAYSDSGHREQMALGDEATQVSSGPGWSEELPGAEMRPPPLSEFRDHDV